MLLKFNLRAPTLKTFLGEHAPRPPSITMLHMLIVQIRHHALLYTRALLLFYAPDPLISLGAPESSDTLWNYRANLYARPETFPGTADGLEATRATSEFVRSPVVTRSCSGGSRLLKRGFHFKHLIHGSMHDDTDLAS